MSRFSIIICKYDSFKFNNCIENIQATLADDYELIVVDNSNNDFDLFTAYNEGVERSTGDILCFMHEDIIYHDKDWDKKVIQYFKNDKSLGMIGIAGGASYHKFAWSWNQTHVARDYAISIMSCENDTRSHYKEGFVNSTKQVLLVDGLWFCIRSSILKIHNIQFDSTTFKGFHRYDYDISLQIAKISKIKVIDNIRIEHQSSGHRNMEWMEANIKFQEKWRHILPCKIREDEVGIYTIKQSSKDLKAFYKFIVIMHTHKISSRIIRKTIRQHFRLYSSNIGTQLKIIVIYFLGCNNFTTFKKIILNK